jgi:signal transduction histidine kinase
VPSVRRMNPTRILSRLGKDTQHILLGFPLGLIAVVLSMTLFWLGVGLSIVWIGLPLLMGTFLMVRGLAVAERARVGAVLGHRLTHPGYKRAAGASLWRRMFTPMSDGQNWLDLLHAMFRFIPATIAFSFVLTWWVGAISGLTFPLWDWSISRGPDNTDLPELIGLGTGTGVRYGFYLACGLFFALTLYPVVRGMALMDTAFSRLLLSRVGELREQVAQAELARDTAQAQKNAAVSAEAIALRRLERDIHDGPQQRLVRLAMDLGRAEQQFAHDPDAARATVTEALSQTRETLDELRALSRGIAPPILVDRGLTAALTAVAGRCTVPVELVALGIDRLDPAVETAAYFVVAESLTNVAKHSQATEAAVTVRQFGGRLLVEVTDNGIGGAAVDKGTGLAGLEERVHAAGGDLRVDSAPGEGTAVRVSLPI